MRLIFFYLLCLSKVFADIVSFTDHAILPLSPEYWTIAKWSSKDAPNWSPGRGKSFIDLSRLQISTKCNSNSYFTKGDKCDDKPVAFDIVMFLEPGGKNWVDYWPNKQFCCTSAMVSSKECTAPNTFIYPAELPMAIRTTVTAHKKPISLTPQVYSYYLITALLRRVHN